MAPANPSSLPEQQQFYGRLAEVLMQHAQRLSMHKKESSASDADFERTINAQRKEETTIVSTISQGQQQRTKDSQKQAKIKNALRKIESNLGKI